jgi:adenine phosphoribosyltransferase
MIKQLIRTIPHYPKQGVMFRDITTVLKDPAGFRWTIDALLARYRDQKISKVAAIEARGFIFGGPLAYALGAGLVPVRKRGKLPGKVIGREYTLEYGAAAVELHEDAIDKGERVLLIDDLIATGGTAEAAVKLVQQLGGEVIECCFAIDLPDLGGRRRLEALGLPVFALCEFEGE